MEVDSGYPGEWALGIEILVGPWGGRGGEEAARQPDVGGFVAEGRVIAIIIVPHGVEAQGESRVDGFEAVEELAGGERGGRVLGVVVMDGVIAGGLFTPDTLHECG